MAIRHKALCPFLHASPPLLSFLKASFFYLSIKSHSSLPRKPVSFFPIFFTCVCFSPLECVSGSGRASLRTQTRKRQDIEWRKKQRYTHRSALPCLFAFRACGSVHVWEIEDKIVGSQRSHNTGLLRFPSNLNRRYFPWKTSRFPTSLPNPAFALNPKLLFFSEFSVYPFLETPVPSDLP